jgi:hypothetical protein
MGLRQSVFLLKFKWAGLRLLYSRALLAYKTESKEISFTEDARVEKIGGEREREKNTISDQAESSK